MTLLDALRSALVTLLLTLVMLAAPVIAPLPAAPATAPSAAPALPAGLVSCTEEDGSAPGQAFPCRWDAAAHGNGAGESFTLWDATSAPDYS